MDHRGLGPRDEHRDRGRRGRRVDASPRRRRRVHPMQRENEQRRRDEISELADVVHHDFAAVWDFVSLNILSILWVIRNPLTMFVTEAKTAMAPSARMWPG